MACPAQGTGVGQGDTEGRATAGHVLALWGPGYVASTSHVSVTRSGQDQGSRQHMAREVSRNLVDQHWGGLGRGGWKVTQPDCTSSGPASSRGRQSDFSEAE